MVHANQLCEHLKPASIPSVLTTGWDMMIIRGASLMATHVRIDRAPRGFHVTHGKYRELRAMVSCPDCGGPLKDDWHGVAACFCRWGGRAPTIPDINP